MAITSVFLAAQVRGQEPQDTHAVVPETTSGEADPHAAHRAMMQASSFQVADADYSVPDVTLLNQAGQAVALRQLFSGDRPVAVNFIYTSCTTICPVMTATMLQMQRELGDAASKLQFVSISIDPDYDTAVTLGAYARRFGADWTFLTGQRADVLDVLKAFSAWRGSKSNHAAITLFRPAGAKRWTRIEGLASAKQLVDVWNSGIT
ncbi:MAG: SCO family protein [Steroidobacteraceae bacterium]